MAEHTHRPELNPAAEPAPPARQPGPAPPGHAAPAHVAATSRLASAIGNRAFAALMTARQDDGPPPRPAPGRTAPPTVARAPDFTPTFGGAAGVVHFENLNADIKLTTTVKNASSAPSGTKMVWSWRPPELDGVEKGAISPATGPSGTFTAKARKPTPDKANDELGAQVDVEEPGRPATIHAVKPPMRVAVLEPEYRIEEKVVPGAKGGGTAPGALKPGDVLEFHVTLGNVDKPKELGDAGHFRWHLSQEGAFLSELGGLKIPDDKPFEARAHRWDGDTLVYSVYCHHAGTGKYKIDFNVPGTKAYTKEVALKSESSLGFFLARCGAATERHRAIVATFDAYLQQGFMNYKSGYEAAEAAFKEYAERQKLTKEILLGILFAGLGGAAGGAAGGLVKFSATQKAFAGKLTKVQEMGLGALTDAPKDIAKYTVRLGRRLGEGGGKGGPTPDDATPDAHGGGGKSGVAGSEDPLNWHALAQKAKSLEEAKIAVTLEGWKTSTIDAIARGSETTIDFDPINEITAITKLDGKGIADLGAPPSAAEYEKNMWEAWIEKYAYTLKEKVGCGQWGSRVEDNVGKELKAEMERVAKVLAEKGIESSWLNEALTEARRRADEKAAASQKLGL